MNVNKKKSSLKRIKSKTSQPAKSISTQLEVVKNAEKIGITVVMIYWTLIKWIIVIVISGGAKLIRFLKPLIYGVKKRLISIRYRSIAETAVKKALKISLKIFKTPFIIISFLLSLFGGLSKKFTFLKLNLD